MCFRLSPVFIYSAWNQERRLLEDNNSISSKPKKMVSNPRWSHLSLSVKTLTYCFCFIFYFTFTNKLIKLLWLDPQFRCLTFMFLVCQLMRPVISPPKSLFGYLVKFPLGVSFQFFEEHFHMELSHRPFPPPSRAQSNELPSNEPRGIIKAQAISRFLGLELRCSWRKAFNYKLLVLNNKL